MSGYGVSNYQGRRWQVHRLVWTLLVGPIPEGRIACHKCDNPPCCNPEHIFIGTQRDNVRDSIAKGRFQGHRPGDDEKRRSRPFAFRLTSDEKEAVKIAAKHAGVSVSDYVRAVILDGLLPGVRDAEEA